MAIPRWQERNQESESVSWKVWEKLLAFIAIINLGWILFDISYIPLRSFWLNRSIYITNSSSISLKWIPNITDAYDKIKGIKTDEKSKENQIIFKALSKEIKNGDRTESNLVQQLLKQYESSTIDLLKSLPSRLPDSVNKVETIKTHLYERSEESNYIIGIKKLLSKNYISNDQLKSELLFWETEILPLIRTNYSRIINQNGTYMQSSWKIDFPFQILFLIDIILSIYKTKRKFPKIKLSNAILKRWIDLPLLLPFMRLLRLIPITERISKAKLIQFEPIRAVISQWVVALVAIEIIEILTFRTIDSIQNIIRSPILPEKIRGLCSYQSIQKKETSEISDFIRIWVPLLLKKIGPNMRPQLISLFEHAIQRSLENNSFPKVLKNNKIIEIAESTISIQMASSLVDTIIEWSKNTGTEISKKDIVLEALALKVIDRFWEEIASSLEDDTLLKNSQFLLTSILEEFKLLSLNEFTSQDSMNKVISELDDFNSKRNFPT
ncbi:hypothetical protein [Prochlorococcus marinus]|uniref:hypothetical protein n=1 Tax=Prochlorococcus marinus TaxID=1219 RepID=UPI0022B5250D|nr:hypothetical protein [Prochlorococcus marinus]